LLVHDEPGIVDLLRESLEAHGIEVECHDALELALARVPADEIDVVVTAWDRPLGAELYRRVLETHRDRRHRFVFVIDEIPAKLAEAAAGRRVVRLDDRPALLAAIDARLRKLRTGPALPRLLLADDDPEQLAAFAELLAAHGFEVATVTGGNAAIDLIGRTRFDVVLSDWLMPDGSGAALHAWITANRPDLSSAIVFVTGGDVMEVRARVGAVPVVPKGQDSPPLLAHLRRSVIEARLARGTPARGIRAVSAEGLPLEPMPMPAIPPPPAFSLPEEPEDEPTLVDR
jgi:CheY-like chemotaxis protein